MVAFKPTPNEFAIRATVLILFLNVQNEYRELDFASPPFI